jgi:hypothetical protein
MRLRKFLDQAPGHRPELLGRKLVFGIERRFDHGCSQGVFSGLDVVRFHRRRKRLIAKVGRRIEASDIALHKTRDWLANVSRRQHPNAGRVARLMADLPMPTADLFDPDAVSYIDFERMVVVGWLLTARPSA